MDVDQNAPSVPLSEDDLLQVVHSLIQRGDALNGGFYSRLHETRTSVYLPSLFLFGLSEFTTPVDEETEVRLSMHHVIELRSLLDSLAVRKRLGRPRRKLKQGAIEHQETHPENAILSEMLASIDSFMNVPSDSPQMVFASLLEKLLEKSELWEKTVGRTYSLAIQLTPLRETLLEWRKSEVRCWSEILKRVGDDLKRQCVLSAWPLIDAFTTASRPADCDEANYRRNLIAMLLQWIQDSSLFDLPSRLLVCRLLVVVLRSTGCHEELIPKVEAIGRYFASFLPRLEAKVKEVRADVEERLNNLVQVARYTDLNLWSVKDSAQRVHGQLCRLIHQFKVAVNKPALLLFTDEIGELPTFEPARFVSIGPFVSPHHHFTQLVSQLDANFLSLISADAIENLSQNAEQLCLLVQTDVDYAEVERQLKADGKPADKEAVDEAKRKAHAAELAKAAADVRGLQLGTEEMSELSMTGAAEGASEVLKSLVTSSIAVRNVAIKSLAAHFALLKGVVEFGLSVIVNTNNRTNSLVKTADSIRSARVSLGRLLEIKEVARWKVPVDHAFLCAEMIGLFTDLSALKDELQVVQNGHLHLLLGQTFNHFRLLERQFAERVGRMVAEEIQTVYRIVEQQKAVERATPIERLRSSLTSIGAVNLQEIEERIWSFVWSLGSGRTAVSEGVREVFSAVAALVDALEVISRRMVLFLEWFSLFHLRFAALAHHLTEKGLVNRIPEPEKSEGDAQGTTGSGDAAGMGEGQGENDVSDQIEETGQLEDLEGAEQNADEQPSGGKEPEKDENPIEMEDDFAADLEGIDGEEQGDDDQEGPEEEDAAEQADWDTGDVDEADEKQLDPKLWEEQPEVPQGVDQEEQGADEQTGELTAQNEQPKQQTEVDETNEKEPAEAEEEPEDHMENVDEINLDGEDDEEGGADPEDPPMDVEVPADEEKAEEGDAEGPADQNEEEEGGEEAENQQDDVNLPEPPTQEQTNTDDTTFGLPMSADEQQAANQANAEQQPNEAEAADMTNEANQEVGGEKRGMSTADKPADQPDDENQAPDESTPASAMAASRQQTDDQLMDVDPEAITEQTEETPLDERSDRFAHIADQQLSAADRQVIQKATVDEAKGTRDRLQNQQPTAQTPAVEEASRPANSTFAKITGESHILDGTFLRTNMDREYVNRPSNGDCGSVEEVAGGGRASGSSDLEAKWAAISESVAAEATELAENLRIIIEPTIASKLQGDYRTGKRLNMRRLVPYIASNFRKDRIWLRRTKAANRNYQICLAIDDSASMADNLMTEITCQAVCLLERAFQQLAVGEVSICKFGAEVHLLRDFPDPPASDELGGRFAAARAPANQLLIIVGDGRGTLNQGAERVGASISRLLDEGVVVLYLIVDNPSSSVFAIKSFQKNRLVDYMSVFPFPFYTVVQSKAIIPLAVSEAITQWFAMTEDH
ncbi:Midasin [Aphelenchoides fujianensis]|nr:Midasin [Aphelenchoides fujianensis]